MFFRKSPKFFQKVMQVLTSQKNDPAATVQSVKAAIVPMLRGQKHLLEEFSKFFENDKPPEP